MNVYILALIALKQIYRAFEYWLNELGIRYPRIDYRIVLNQPLARPPFILPFKDDIIDKLVFGDILLLLCIDYDKWLSLTEKYPGLSWRWMSKKETHQIKVKYSKLKPLIYKNRGIEVTHKDKKSILFDGILVRVLFDLIKPSSIINMLTIDMIKPEK